MKKLLVLFLFVLSSKNLSTNIELSTEYQNNINYLYNVVLYNQLNKITDNANKILDSSLSTESLPLSLPIKIEDFKRISSKYGERVRHPILRYRTYHNGIDIVTDLNAEVHAAGKGIVTRSQYAFLGYGKFIEIDHGNNITTIYAHLNSIFVNKGDTVNVGQLIGTVGSTGLSTGPHLHYEIRKDFLSINPISLYCNTSLISEEELIKVMNITKLLVQNMETKTITKKISLNELKELKDQYVRKITVLEYNIKNNKIKKLDTLKNTIDKVNMEQENLVRIKLLLSKANSIEFYDDKSNTRAAFTNNEEIYKLALLRDLKTTLTKVKESKDLSTDYIEFVDEQISELTSKIDILNNSIREFNTTTKIEIELLEKV